MNTETGAIYRGDEQIRAALRRGEPLARVSERVATLVELGQARTRNERRRLAQATRAARRRGGR